MDYAEILKKIKPADNKELKRIIKELKKDIEEEIRKKEYKARFFLGGSIAKNTYLKNNKDVDIFIIYNNETRISEKTKELIKKYKPETKHWSRDYYNLNYKGYNIEIIPVKKITDKAENIMDYSPLHVKYIKTHLNKPDEARLLKYYLQQNNLYGAETHKKGLSGYVVELLTIKYGTFKKTLKEIAKLGKTKTITFNNEEPANKTSLTIMDPAQPERNASAALSEENYKKLVKLAREYVKNPSEKNFENNLTIEKIKNENTIIKEFKIKGKRDVYLAKLSRKLNKTIRQLKNNDFDTTTSGIIENEDKAWLYIRLKHATLPEQKKHYGPPEKMKEHAEKFK